MRLRFKAGTMPRRILVTYATRAGSTAEVATAIADTLTWRGFAVDLKPVTDEPAVDGYAAVLVGSAIRMGSWLPEAVAFIQANRPALSALPVAYFTVHLLNREATESSRQAREAYTAPVRALLGPVAEVFFAGKMEQARLSPMDRLVSTLVKAQDEDFRDWDKIRQWGETVLA
jgi:menaquinone-dependent protoporphyrinogen oxidase